MPKTAKQMEKELLADGWKISRQKGSHRQYIHPSKKGTVTIPMHSGDLTLLTERSIRKQAGL